MHPAVRPEPVEGHLIEYVDSQLATVDIVDT